MEDNIKDQKIPADFFDLSKQKQDLLYKLTVLDLSEIPKANLRALEEFKRDNPGKETKKIEEAIANAKVEIQEEEAKNKAYYEGLVTADKEKAS